MLDRKMSDPTGYGLRCPKCGYDDHLYIRALTEARVMPHGNATSSVGWQAESIKIEDSRNSALNDHGGIIRWDQDSVCTCPGCNHQSTVKDFSIMGEQIVGLKELMGAALLKRSVISPSYGPCKKPLPASAVLNWQGRMLLHAFSAGLYLYNARGKDYGTE